MHIVKLTEAVMEISQNCNRGRKYASIEDTEDSSE